MSAKYPSAGTVYLCDEAARSVAFFLGCDTKQLGSTHRRGRTKAADAQRNHLARWVLYELGFAYADIGRTLDLDHTTVMNSVKRASDYLDRSGQLAVWENLALKVDLRSCPEWAREARVA